MLLKLEDTVWTPAPVVADARLATRPRARRGRPNPAARGLRRKARLRVSRRAASLVEPDARSRGRRGHPPSAALMLCMLPWLLGPAFSVAFAAGPSGPELRPVLSPIDSPMDASPELTPPEPIPTLHARLPELWRQALRRPDNHTVLLASRAVKQAVEQNVPTPTLAELSEPLQAVVNQNRYELSTRAAAAEALIAIGVESAGGTLATLLHAADRSGRHDLVRMLAPVLARWGEPSVLETARRRIDQRLSPSAGSAVRSSAMMLAWIKALEQGGGPEDAAPLVELARDAREAFSLRLAAADVAGTLRSEGLESHARAWLDPSADHAARDEPRRDRDATESWRPKLLAVRLLRRHDSDEAGRLLVTQIRSDRLVLVAEAGEALVERHVDRLRRDIDRLMVSDSAAVRHVAARALDHWRDVDAVSALVSLLDDPDPVVRAFSREALIRCDERPGLRSRVRSLASAALNRQGWRGREQACHLLGIVDHEPAFQQLIHGLEDEHPAVAIAAASAIRRLDVPDMAPRVLDAFARLIDKTTKTDRAADAVDPNRARRLGIQLAQLAQYLGVRRHAPAERFLRKFVPKGSFDVDARAAAIWALGLIHENQAPRDLSSALRARLSDQSMMNPEAEPVRRQAAVALGRMGAQGMIGALRRFDAEESDDGLRLACRWALARITGERAEPLAPARRILQPGFLTPIDRAEEPSASAASSGMRGGARSPGPAGRAVTAALADATPLVGAAGRAGEWTSASRGAFTSERGRRW